ncbi:ESX-4 secretion system protein EccC4 [Madurella fahalii]|uniref:ESX-4 secretion system protein EccC4 n=1 Tax=Madurella fahalii TaxID=1157608 RepID=A0ABQ0GC35_9PEZI
METILSMLACILCRRGEREGYTELIYAKRWPCIQTRNHTRTVEEVAEAVARLLWLAEWNDDALQSRISEAVGDRRWNRKMVEECLNYVIEYVEQGRVQMGAAMCEALDKATDIADEEFAFPRRHPESLDGFIAIVSVGVLAEMQGAWVLELLGFGEVRGKETAEKTGEVAMLTSDKIVMSPNPRSCSVAAWWAREYQAYIPRDSVASYLRRMDMIETGPES